MKISNLFNTTNIYNKTIKNDKKVEKTKKDKDTFVVSDKAKDFQTVLKAVSNSPDVRQDKIDKIKSQIEEKSYNVSTEDIVEKLFSRY
ncbi:flagellar biosynthesis anti-sigma factor FlgM [[Clostridium] colinum]|uniref:flagellar biosynthesis anti-sigma factor FlgM n=1 Tax=[Clostridium] colinum TaxID=36835 RepID=UPI002025B2C0|nr:flagellar biosynthesis anti-sigma factor FlgM [[Clostridium] colinum]